jgi:O-antigen ligase
MRKLAFSLSLVLIFSIPWEDAITIGGINSLTRYLGIFVTAIWLISIISSKSLRRPSFFHVLFFLFVLWNAASLFWTVAYDVSLQEVNTYIQLLVLSLIIWDLYSSSEALYKGLQVFTLGCYVLIVTTIIDYALGIEIGLYSGGRYAGVGNAVDLALVLTLGIPISWHLAISQKINNKFLTFFNFMYLPCALFAIVLTGTRMAIIAVLPALIFIIGTLRQLKLYIRLSSFFVLVGAMVWLEPLIPRSTLGRLGTVFSSISAGDLGGRVELWRQSLSYWIDHPIIGIGSGAIKSPLILNTVAHNTFISVLTELGMIGLLIFLCILFLIIRVALRQAKEYTILWITVLGVWTTGVFTLTWEYKKATWLLFIMIVISGNIFKKPVRNPRSLVEKYTPTNNRGDQVMKSANSLGRWKKFSLKSSGST